MLTRLFKTKRLTSVFAVAIEDGLIYASSKNCDQKNILEISDEIKILAAKANGKN